jgi:hypothetical protein
MKKMNFHSGIATAKIFLIGTTSLFTASLFAQTQPSTPAQQPAASTPHHRSHSKAKPAAATPKVEEPPVPKTLPSLFDQPPQPATITLSNKTLTIHADNSSLTAILQQVSSTSGMQIDGLPRDQRVFGVYGPGEPHAVISSLLNGSGYNIVMLGQTADGTPRQLTLTPRNATPAGQTNRPMNAPNNDDDSEEDTQPPPQEPANEPPPQPNSERPTPNSVRTPQQMMQELQQMRQQQMQQQQQQTQQQPQQTPDNATPPQ